MKKHGRALAIFLDRTKQTRRDAEKMKTIAKHDEEIGGGEEEKEKNNLKKKNRKSITQLIK